MALSLHLRTRVVVAVDAGASRRTVAARFCVSKNTVQNLVNLRRCSGTLRPRSGTLRPRSGGGHPPPVP